MIDFNAFFKMSYGLYIVSSGDQNSGNCFIANAAFQVTAEPPQIAVCCNKDNFTFKYFDATKAFSISILQENASSETISKYGYKCGNDTSKFEGSNVIYGETGTPIVLDDSIAYLECKLVNSFDVGTHLIFVGEIINAVVTDDSKEPLTYSHYRNVRKGLAPKNAPTYVDKSNIQASPEAPQGDKYKCNVCGYEFDESVEGTRFTDLPHDWTCPICGVDREDFSLV